MFFLNYLKTWKLKDEKKHDSQIILMEFNPTLFKENECIYALVRNETDTKKWNDSQFSYKLKLLDEDTLKVRETYDCEFEIEGNIFQSLSRKEIKDKKYCIEDIKVLQEKVNDDILGTCNVLIQTTPKRIFRCGIVKIDIEKKRIILLKVLCVDNMGPLEKNWSVFSTRESFYLIYTIFPEFVIYTLDMKTFTLKFYTKFDNRNISKNTNIMKKCNINYRNICLTCSTLVPIENEKFLMICKSRKQNNDYIYYSAIFSFKEKSFEIIKEDIYVGHKLYLNDVKQIDKTIYECWGINDESYKIIKKNIKEYI